VFYSGLSLRSVRRILSITAKNWRTVFGRRAWFLLHMDTINNAIIQHEPTYFFTCQHQDRSPAKTQTALKSEQNTAAKFSS
jgi:hypothetical protein